MQKKKRKKKCGRVSRVFRPMARRHLNFKLLSMPKALGETKDVTQEEDNPGGAGQNAKEI